MQLFNKVKNLVRKTQLVTDDVETKFSTCCDKLVRHYCQHHPRPQTDRQEAYYSLHSAELFKMREASLMELRAVGSPQ
jgi:hypothetical protein